MSDCRSFIAQYKRETAVDGVVSEAYSLSSAIELNWLLSRAPRCAITGVTRNSGPWINIQVGSSLPFPYLLSFFPPPPSTYPHSLFSSLLTPSRPSLPFSPPLLPTLSFPFLLSPPLITAMGLRERYSSPSGSGWSPAAKRIFVQFTAQNLQIC